ncbi:PTAC2 [Symbiodinium sp. CCMP2456]|nr:PTAC2 [Symbiodinium sp. CCMP2456]
MATAPLFLLMLRYRMLFYPHLVLLGSTLAEIPVGRFRRTVVVALLAMAEANLYLAGVSWSQGHQTQSRDEEKVERERVMSWVRNHTSPEDILIGGMGTSALVRLHARRGIVCHPHYESARLRESCFWADKLVGHRSLAEYHDIISTKLLKGASRQAYVLVSLKDCFSVNEAGQSTSELVEMDEPWRLAQPKTCDLLYRLGFDEVPHGFQPRWLGRWYALLEVLADMKETGKPLQPTPSRRCALGRYLLEEASEAEQARPLLTSLSPKALRKLPVACSCAAEMLGVAEVMHDAHARALQERDDPLAGAFGCCEVGPKFVACLSDKALRLMREASPSLAEIYFRKASEYTSSPKAVGFLAFARLQAGMNREALRSFRRAAELEGTSPTGTTLCGEASALASLGDFKGAADAMRRADHADSRQRCSEHHAGLIRKAFQQPSFEWLTGYRKLQEAWGSVSTVDGWRQFLQHPGAADRIQASIPVGTEKAMVLFLGRPSVHLNSVVQILQIIREVHNLHWPAEFWIEAADASILDDDASQRLKALGAALRAVPSPQGDFPEDHPFWRWQARFALHYRQNPEAVSRLKAYSLKPVVLAVSDCDPCFFLDADNVPLRSPQELIRTLDEFPALFWPDFWPAPRTGLWSSFSTTKSQESGQLMLRKTAEVQEALLLATLLAVRLDIFVEAIYGEQGQLMCGYGDKDVYQLAFRLLGVKFRMVGSSGPSVLVTAGGDYAGLVQLDEDRQSFFAHGSKAKERLWQLLQADALQRCDLQDDQANNLSCTATRGAGSLSIPFDALRCTPLTFPGQGVKLDVGHAARRLFEVFGTPFVKGNMYRGFQNTVIERTTSPREREDEVLVWCYPAATTFSRVAGSTAKAAPAAPPPSVEAQHNLSSNIQGLRFMQSARENEERKKQEKEQLRHIEEMQWVVEGFEAEVSAESSQEKRPAELRTGPPPLQLHRRSYKGFNGLVEQSMKDVLKKHAEMMTQAEEVEQAWQFVDSLAGLVGFWLKGRAARLGLLVELQQPKAPSGVEKPFANMADSKKHMKMGTEESLKTLMRPHMHHAIDTWMAQVGDTEKRGLLRLMRMAHPAVVCSHGPPCTCICQLHIDKPRHPSWIPKCATQKKDYSALPTAASDPKTVLHKGTAAQHDAEVCVQPCPTLTHGLMDVFAGKRSISRLAPGSWVGASRATFYLEVAFGDWYLAASRASFGTSGKTSETSLRAACTPRIEPCGIAVAVPATSIMLACAADGATLSLVASSHCRGGPFALARRLKRLNGPWSQAILIMAEECEQKVAPDLVVFNTLLSVLGRGGAWVASLSVLSAVMAATLRPDIISSSTAIKTFTAGTQWLEGLGLLRAVQGGEVEPDLIAFNSLMTSAYRGQEWEQSMELAARMSLLGVGLDGYSQGALLMACAKGLRWTLALRLLSSRELLGGSGGLVCCSAVLSACDRSLQWASALGLLLAAGSEGLRADGQALMPMLSVLGAKGLWRKAMALRTSCAVTMIRESEESTKAILQACAAAAQSAKANEVLNSLTRPSPTHFDLVVEACGKAEDWEGAVALLSFMRKAQLQTSASGLIAAAQASTAGAACEVLHELRDYFGAGMNVEKEDAGSEMVAAVELLQDRDHLDARSAGCWLRTSYRLVARQLRQLLQPRRGRTVAPSHRLRNSVLEQQHSLGRSGSERILLELGLSSSPLWAGAALHVIRRALDGTAESLKATSQAAWLASSGQIRPARRVVGHGSCRPAQENRDALLPIFVEHDRALHAERQASDMTAEPSSCYRLRFCAGVFVALSHFLSVSLSLSPSLFLILSLSLSVSINISKYIQCKSSITCIMEHRIIQQDIV